MKVDYERLSPNTIKAKNMSDLITNIIGLLVIGVLYYCTQRFNWWEWLDYVWIGLFVITILSIIWTYTVGSPMFYKTFHYAITDDYLYIKSGVWMHSEVVVPMTKIQSIELKQGSIMRKYKVSSVHVATMQGEHEIPYIDDAIAKRVRDDIAQLARLKELDAR